MLRCDDAELARRATDLIGEFTRAERAVRGDTSERIVYSLHADRGADGQRYYVLRREDQRVAASSDAGVVLMQLMWHISMDTVELAVGYLMVHAGAVVSPSGEGVVILGESGSGKTTLVAALVQDGYSYLSDEAAAIELTTGLAHPWPRPLGFHDESRSLPRFAALFAPEETRGQTVETHIPVERIRRASIAAPSRVRHVFDHRYQQGAPTRLEPLSRATGLVRMGSAAPRLRREGERGLAVLADVMRAADAYSLVGGDLDRTVETIHERVGR